MKILKSIIVLLFVLLFIFQCTSNYLTTESQLIHEKFWTGGNECFYKNLCEGKPYQTPVFHFMSDQEGPAVLIIGGTHGNEPAGFEAAHRLLHYFAENKLIKGELFIIPEANKLADFAKTRRISVPKNVNKELGNLNRCYPGKADGYPMEQIAYEITALIKQKGIDLVLDLHESPVFHLEYKDDGKEYHGLGQTLIYTPTEETTWLGMVVLDHINSSIPPGIKQFSLAERPVKNSAAWAAGKIHNIPGLTTETCKKLPLEERIGYHLEIVKVILQEKGML